MAKANKAVRRAGTAHRKLRTPGFKATTMKAPGALSKAARRARAKAGGKRPVRRIVVNNPELEAALQAAVLRDSLERMASAPI